MIPFPLPSILCLRHQNVLPLYPFWTTRFGASTFLLWHIFLPLFKQTSSFSIILFQKRSVLSSCLPVPFPIFWQLLPVVSIAKQWSPTICGWWMMLSMMLTLQLIRRASNLHPRQIFAACAQRASFFSGNSGFWSIFPTSTTSSLCGACSCQFFGARSLSLPENHCGGFHQN